MHGGKEKEKEKEKKKRKRKKEKEKKKKKKKKKRRIFGQIQARSLLFLTVLPPALVGLSEPAVRGDCLLC